jgi:hypothetical protein
MMAYACNPTFGEMMIKSNRPWLSVAVLVSSLILSIPAQAETTNNAMPSDKALAEWDANFHPGYYEVTETPLNKKGQPVVLESQTKNRCLTDRDAKAMARSPLTLVSPKECRMDVDFSAQTLTVTAHCLIDGEKYATVASVGVGEGQKQYDSASVKMQVLDGGEAKMIYGTGTHFKYLGTCP